MNKLALTDADIVRFMRIVKKIKFFSSIDTVLLEKILERVSLFQCDTGESVCRQGGPGDAFYVVSEGRLRVSVREAFVFSRTLAHLVAEDCFGEMALLNKEPHNASVTCEENSKIFVLKADSFYQVLQENPTFSAEIKKLAADRQFELTHKSGE
jgi:CRP-like cAMP-binding protein